MLDVRFRPLEKWNRQPALQFRSAAFRTTFSKTLDKIEYEIAHLKGRDIRIEAGFKLADIRNDGWPRGMAKPSHPGAVLYFDTPDASLCFPCGTYSTYTDNLHAIALTLECLRAVDRYGVTLAHEQYRGFAQLPAPAGQMSVDEAAYIFSGLSNVPKDHILESRDAYRQAYRIIAAFAHPDAGGDHEGWIEFQKEAEILERHHNAGAKAGGR